jgi:hypothetical protein
MNRWWQSWVERCGQSVDARALAALRISVAAVALLDLARVGQLGLVDLLYRSYAAGGLSGFTDPACMIDPASMGPPVYFLTLAALFCVLLGVGTRPAILVAVLLWAQLGHLYPPGDRAIDRMLRTVLLFLLFSESHRRWSFAPGAPAKQVGAWPLILLRWMLVLVYTSAGVAKLAQQPGWLSVSGMPVLYRILADPMASSLDPLGAAPWWWLLRALGWGTIALELSSFLLLTRWSRFWIPPVLVMHLGIAWSMKLGMFSGGMIAFYLPLTVTWWAPWLDRRQRSMVS